MKHRLSHMKYLLNGTNKSSAFNSDILKTPNKFGPTNQKIRNNLKPIMKLHKS